MNNTNRARLELMTARYAPRLAAAAPRSDEATFLREFAELCAKVVRPVMEECAEHLRAAGLEPRVLLDEGFSKPSIELALGLRCAYGTSNRVGFAVIQRDGPPKILAYLEVDPPQFDLTRFARAAEATAERVEHVVVEGIEQILATNAANCRAGRGTDGVPGARWDTSR